MASPSAARRTDVERPRPKVQRSTLDLGHRTSGRGMGMDYRELAQGLLKRAAAKGASGAEVITVEDEPFSVQVRMRAVDTLQSAREKRLGLRLCFGQRSATTATSDFSPESLH